jgi:hypothetical protein
VLKITTKTENNFNLQNIDKTFTLQYDKYYNKYFLLIPKEISKLDNDLEDHIKKQNKNKFIKTNLEKISIKKVNNNLENRIKEDNKCGIDGGIRTFLTVYNENEVLEIGTDIKSILLPYFNKIDKITSLKDTNELSNTLLKFINSFELL